MKDIIETELLSNDEMLAISGGRKDEPQVCGGCSKVERGDVKIVIK